MFDDNLTWNQHATYIAGRCTTRLNIMWCITGKTWGGGKKVLLTMYKVLIQ